MNTFLCLFFCTGTASAIAQPLIVRVGLYENPPKIFTEDGQPAGIFVDLLNDISRREGWKLQYISGSWAQNLDRLERGEIDLIPDMAYSAKRAQIYTFPKVPALSSWFQVYAPRGHHIHSILDLNHKRIMVLERSIQDTAFERLRKGFELQCELVRVDDYKSMFSRVQRGEADVAVTNRFYGMMNGRKYGLEDTAVVFEPSDLYYAAAKNDPKHLLPTIDRYLSEMKAEPNSLYYQSVLHWTSQKVAFRWPLWLKIGGGVGAGILLFSLLGGAILKYQVNLRTRELRQINQEMEERIRERTAELATITREQVSIFESAGVGIIMLRDRVIVRCNQKTMEMTGYKYDELIGMSTRMWYGSQKAYEKACDQVYGQLARGETHRRSQQVTRKDGTVFWARLSLRAFDENKPKDGAVAILEDISEERRAAETLRRAMEKAQEADRTKSSFLATMSHELRTPLNSIIGFTGILVQGLAGPLNEEQSKQLQMVQKSSRHLLSLINDVLDISKIEAGQLELSHESFDLNPTLTHVLSLVTPLAEEKGLTLEFQVKPQLGSICADKRRFEQILINLLNNAIKFTEQGSVILACQAKENEICLSIRDTGIGMEKKELKEVFQPFHQVESGLARKHEGSGLGLAICQRLAAQMGGVITVASTLGQGSTFTLTLPRETTIDQSQEVHA
ncbi:transporter substrate-binding domain-containing protein [Desulfobulbus rhabdoformis]|uniref:ATP-binding protein n=1 Tax=Desulfobulbus rhabdoformis TaxID=34032 RepID=UPI001963E67B|nr:ATP-binding protein [Desulfobulbus rhabdoformis]MBM9615228.1 transporter substrate-binding domain-containing protein [Desulfobulbus rhabdoformis]